MEKRKRIKKGSGKKESQVVTGRKGERLEGPKQD